MEPRLSEEEEASPCLRRIRGRERMKRIRNTNMIIVTTKDASSEPVIDESEASLAIDKACDAVAKIENVCRAGLEEAFLRKDTI